MNGPPRGTSVKQQKKLLNIFCMTTALNVVPIKRNRTRNKVKLLVHQPDQRFFFILSRPIFYDGEIKPLAIKSFIIVAKYSFGCETEKVVATELKEN
jgi:hypothetical protein